MYSLRSVILGRSLRTTERKTLQYASLPATGADEIPDSTYQGQNSTMFCSPSFIVCGQLSMGFVSQLPAGW